MQIRFDQGPAGPDTCFDTPSRLIEAAMPADVPAALAALDRAVAGGAWIAGYASYELGYALEPRLGVRMPPNRSLPLLRFGVYDAPRADANGVMGADGTTGAAGAGGADRAANLARSRPRWDPARYRAAFDQLHDYIGAGDLYQGNLTFPMDTATTTTPTALYSALAAQQPVPHGALVLQPGLPALLSRSPELFFALDGQGGITTRPMKGTQPRGSDPSEDRRRKTFLANDPKNRAENLMIVDLLRNDLSRIAAPGSVQVPDLFQIETYATLHQMVSRVTAQLRPDAGIAAILTALFPCGSITGAPKLRAMEILDDLEQAPRDIYCGSIGWMAPDGRASFNVAIRTLMLAADGAIRYNVGGGVVWDSTADNEYEEALWKARFARPMIPTSA